MRTTRAGVWHHPDGNTAGSGGPLAHAGAGGAGGLCDNERAIRLYEKLGFEQEGLLRMTTVRNGRYVDEYKMARIRPGVTAP